CPHIFSGCVELVPTARKTGAVPFRVTKRRCVHIGNTDGLQVCGRLLLTEAGFARYRIEANIDEERHLLLLDLCQETIDGRPFVSHTDDTMGLEERGRGNSRSCGVGAHAVSSRMKRATGMGSRPNASYTSSVTSAAFPATAPRKRSLSVSM